MSTDMMDTIVVALMLVAVVIAIVALSLKDNELDECSDAIAEYMMCIKYNTDGDCSDIILSEYSEEVE